MNRIAINAATVFATVAGLVILWQFRGAALIFCMSLALAAALRPAIEYFMRRGVPMTLPIAATYLPLLGLIGLLIFFSAHRLAIEFNQMAVDSGQVYKQIDEHWRKGNWIEREIARAVPSIDENENSHHDGWELGFARTLFGLTLSAAGILFDTLLIVVLSIYWSLDRVHFERLWLSLFSAATRTPARQIWRAIETEIGKYLRSEFLQSLIAGLLLALGFWLIGCRYPVMLALIGAGAWLIPWVGVVFAVLALAISSLPDLIVNPNWLSLFVLGSATLYTCLILLLLEIVVEPRIFDRQRYSTVLIAFVAISLAMVWGIFGLLVGPPIAVVVQVFGSYLFRRRLGQGVDAAQTPAELASRLAAVRKSVVDSEKPSPELISMIERLSVLMEAARLEVGAPKKGF